MMFKKIKFRILQILATILNFGTNGKCCLSQKLLEIERFSAKFWTSWILWTGPLMSLKYLEFSPCSFLVEIKNVVYLKNCKR